MPRFPALPASLLAVALLLGCASEPAAPTLGAAGEGSPHHELTRANAFLYEISAPGSDRLAGYLLGSVHVLDVPLRLGAGLRANLDAADALVLEIDPANLQLETMTGLMLRYGLLEDGENLETLLSADTYALLTERLEQPDFSSAEQLGALRMRPWAITMLLFEKQMASSGLLAVQGVDFYFAEERPDGAPILELETADEQLSAMASLSPSQADAMLRESLEAEHAATTGAESELKVLLDAWKSGDERRLVEVMFARAEENAELHETLFVARNERMSLRVQELLEEDPDRLLFVVVGAGHVIGEESVPEMLRAGGYTVRRAH